MSNMGTNPCRSRVISKVEKNHSVQDINVSPRLTLQQRDISHVKLGNAKLQKLVVDFKQNIGAFLGNHERRNLPPEKYTRVGLEEGIVNVGRDIREADTK